MSDETKVTQEYGAEQIQVLEGLEAVRKRPGMYIGSTSSSGLHHLVYEIVDNAIDEALAGYCKHITVTINPGNSITVTDDGRGIPVDIQPQTGRPALEVVYTVLHAGGKFGGGGYKVSGGLHGVGASVVNALSEWLRVRVHKNGNIYEMKFARGHITQEMKIVGKTDHTGTEVTFQPDPEMFDTLVYDYEILHERMREEAFLNAGLSIAITDDREEGKKQDVMCFEGGIREFVRWANRNKTPVFEDDIITFWQRTDTKHLQRYKGIVKYDEALTSFTVVSCEPNRLSDPLFLWDCSDIHVVGNTFDGELSKREQEVSCTYAKCLALAKDIDTLQLCYGPRFSALRVDSLWSKAFELMDDVTRSRIIEDLKFLQKEWRG